MKTKLIPLLAALALLLTACGSGGGDSAASSTGSYSSAPQTAPEALEAPDAPESAGGWDLSYDETPQDVPPANTKVILTGELELETKEFDSALQALDALAAELGGWYESRTINQGGRCRSVYAVIRVPAQNFSALMERAGEAAHMVSSTSGRQDVSEAYYDSEARLSTQRTKLERLQTLLAQAESMEDIIALESALSETELQIELLTGSLRKYDSLIDYSTVTVSLYEVYRLSSDQEVPMTFGQRLGGAFATGFQRGLDGLEDLAVSAARNWMSLLLWAAVIAAAVIAVRRLLRKRRSRAVPVPQAAPAEREKDAGQK